ncbi:O-antigen ligase family protein [Streptomyces pristinaespiralis]|uniref:O-antigen polymerase n=2 Tax=Streptomyces pristinaespiralis TaxID=38300 RepID=A0A0M4DBJ8_STRPR|nr:O-antigen ligase family protein [Streptomyces pristinaespiralis]ALC24766.1 O-antigen polymerase [Streptomyces pristinaespiralis]QMU12919.1 O-antigen ligase family protein [Streptomyces pristinaespiralis]
MGSTGGPPTGRERRGDPEADPEHGRGTHSGPERGHGHGHGHGTHSEPERGRGTHADPERGPGPDTRGQGTDAGPERRNGTDAAGVVVLVGCAVWSLVSAAGRDGRPEGVLLAVFAVTAGYACGRISGSLLPVGGFVVTASGALAVAVASHDGVVPGAAAGAVTPLGQTGAVAALLVLGTGAACCAASAARTASGRTASHLFALAVACSALALASVPAFAACVTVMLCSLAAALIRRRTAVLTALALTTGLVAGATWAVAEDALPSGLATSVEAPLTVHRVELWRDAVTLARQEPVRGVGPARFGRLSPTSVQSPASGNKPHSAPLQQAAEQGVVGVALLAAVFGWILYGLRRSPRPAPVTLSAAAALTAVAVLACVGNVLSFAPVTTGAALLAGLATARTTREGQDL